MEREIEQFESHRRRRPIGERKSMRGLAKETRELHKILAVADERTRRLVVGFLAREYGRGGISHFSRITGLSPHTIRRGQRELQHPLTPQSGRVRRPGAGRKRVEVKFPGC